MNLCRIHAAPPPELAHALDRFERQFTYPLGPGRSFRISHGDDYTRFYRSMGEEAACFVAEREGSVIGVLGAALRRLLLPGGDTVIVGYLGDLKVDPAARGGRALPRLAQGAGHWLQTRTQAAQAAFGVVMDGTRVLPPAYTGRLGIPPFVELGKVTVLRLPTAGAGADPRDRWETESAPAEACSARLSAGRYASIGGHPSERSETKPLWLVDPTGQACGRLEDTLRAKRLIADDGVEMRSAHLSRFAYSGVRAGVQLLRVVRHHAFQRAFPALFVSIPAAEAEAFCQSLSGTEVVLAPATVFGAGLEAGHLWNVNTAEI